MGDLPTCPSENTLLALVAGTRAGDACPDVLDHVETCCNCRELVSIALQEVGANMPQVRPCLGVFVEGAIIAERYRIARYLGRGGMGVVYAADDILLGMPVALKCVSPTIASGTDEVRHLCRELRHGRKVSHINVCRLFDVGVHEPTSESRDTGQPQAFMTMELLTGETLGARLRREGRQPIATVHDLVRQLVAGLEAAHREGVIHRDLKPENIFLVPNGGDTRLVITDFGLARSFGGNATSTTSSMRPVVGTAAYTSPEQVEGRPVTPASDIYSMGVILYELVTGRLPFVGRSAMATAALRLIETPRSPGELVADLPPAWTRAILRCLEREPDRRFAKASDLLAGLAHGIEVSTRRRRPPSWRAVSVAGLLVTAAGLVAAPAFRQPAESAPPQPVSRTVSPLTVPIPAAPTAGIQPPVNASPAPPTREPMRRRPRQSEPEPSADMAPPTLPPVTAAPSPFRSERDDVVNPF